EGFSPRADVRGHASCRVRQEWTTRRDTERLARTMGLRDLWDRLTGRESIEDLRAAQERQGRGPDGLPMAEAMPPFDEAQEPLSAGRVEDEERTTRREEER